MSKRTQVHLASIFLSLAIVLLASFLMLTFYVPRLITVWEGADRALAVWELTLVRISQFSQALGWPLLIVLTAVLLASLTWRILAQIQLRQARA